MIGPSDNLWLVLQLARDSLQSGSLRRYWSGLARHGTQPGRGVRAFAALVWVGLVPLVPAMAARRRRLIARALEGVVRAIVDGVDPPVAVQRAVALLQRKGLQPDQTRADLERLVAGFLSSPSGADAARSSRARGSRFTRVG